jgi:hypothetical protein
MKGREDEEQVRKMTRVVEAGFLGLFLGGVLAFLGARLLAWAGVIDEWAAFAAGPLGSIIGGAVLALIERRR